MSAGDGHRDVFGILELDAVFGTGVPDGIFRRELTVTFDFGRTGVVKVQPPMSNVAVVPDPVEQLASADIVVPTPVHVDAGLDIRLHLRWADPGFVIKLRRRWSHGQIPAR